MLKILDADLVRGVGDYIARLHIFYIFLVIFLGIAGCIRIALLSCLKNIDLLKKMLILLNFWAKVV